MSESAESSQLRQEKPKDGAEGLASGMTATIVSSDRVWARLLALNLTKRGLTARPSVDLKSKELSSGDWLVLDFSGLEEDWRSVVRGLENTRLAIAVEADTHPSRIHEIDADAVIEKSADMRIMARSIIEIFRSGPIDRELRRLKIRW